MPDTVQDLIRQAAKTHGVPEALALAVAEQESGFNPTLINPKKVKTAAGEEQAVGTFQFLPSTAKLYDIDPMDPRQNIEGGAKYLRDLMDRHNGNIEAVLKEYGGVVDDTTYVPGVLARVRRFQSGQSTPAAPPSGIPPAAAILPGATPQSTVAGDPYVDPKAKIGPGPSLATRISRVATPAVGAMIGGVKGAAMGTPGGAPGMFLGGVVGAGLGAGAGEAIQIGGERLTEPQLPQTTTGVLDRIGSSMREGMLGEGIGRAVMPVINRVLAPLKSKLEPYARDAIAEFTERTPDGNITRVLPSEVSRSRLMNVAENVAEGSLLGGARVTETREARQVLAEARVGQALSSLGVAPAEVSTIGKAAQGSRAGLVKQFRREENAAWNAFRTEAADIPIATPRSDAFIAKVLGQEETAILPNAGATAARKVAQLAGEDAALPSVGGYTTENIKQLPASVQQAVMQAQAEAAAAAPPMTVVQFQKTVSDLGKLTRGLEQAALGDPSKYNAQLGIAKQLYLSAQQDLADTLRKASPKAYSAYENARTVSKLGNEKLFNDTVMDMVKTAPEKVVDLVVRPNNSTAINAVREAVGPRAFKFVQSHALRDLIQEDPVKHQIDWPAVSRRLNSMGDDTLNALFPGGHAEQVKHVANLMIKLQRQPVGQLGRMAIQLSQGGAMLGVATGNFRPEAAAVFFGPVVISRIMTNPTALKWLTVGLQAKDGSKLAARAGSQLLTFMLTPTDEEKAQWAQETPTEAPVELEPAAP